MKFKNVNHIWQGAQLGVQVAEGYVWHVWPVEHTEGIGYHGNDDPPADADYLADGNVDGCGDGYLVLTPDDEQPAIVGGWAIEPILELDKDWGAADESGWNVRVVGWRNYGGPDGDHREMVFAGTSL